MSTTHLSPDSPASSPLPLAPQERDSLAGGGVLAVNARGEEVMAGLDARETAEYLRFLRTPSDDPQAQARHAELTLKIERVRLQRAGEAPDDRAGVLVPDAA